jgi:transcriptional regulator with XRE-family HTH domain
MMTTGYSDGVARKTKPALTPMGQWVRAIREGARLTQAEFGARLRSAEDPVHPTTVTRWERGVMGMDVGSIVLITKAFPNAPRPPLDGVSDPDRTVPSDHNEGDYIVKTDQGRIIAKMIDAIEDEGARTDAMLACAAELKKNPSELGAGKRADRVQRK